MVATVYPTSITTSTRPLADQSTKLTRNADKWAFATNASSTSTVRANARPKWQTMPFESTKRPKTSTAQWIDTRASATCASVTSSLPWTLPSTSTSGRKSITLNAPVLIATARVAHQRKGLFFICHLPLMCAQKRSPFKAWTPHCFFVWDQWSSIQPDHDWTRGPFDAHVPCWRTIPKWHGNHSRPCVRHHRHQWRRWRRWPWLSALFPRTRDKRDCTGPVLQFAKLPRSL